MAKTTVQSSPLNASMRIVVLHGDERFLIEERTRDLAKALEERFGAANIVNILEGVPTEKVLSTGHDRLPTFGIGRDRKRAEWQSLIRQLVAAGSLRLDVAGYGGLAITPKGRERLDTARQHRAVAQELQFAG